MRLGDLDKLKENFIKWLPKEGEDLLSDIHPIENIAISAIMEIEEAPTINPEDLRPRSKWESFVKKYNGQEILYVRCKRCGKERPFDYELIYCNKCGAKMKE